MNQAHQMKMMQKAILLSNIKVATTTSDRKKRKVTDTRNRDLQQKLLSKWNFPIITMAVDPLIDDMVATCGGNTHALVMPTTKVFITDMAHSSAQVLWNPGHVRRTGR